MGKGVVRYLGRGATKYGGESKKRDSHNLYRIHGLKMSVFENKDSPDYKPHYGKTYTERQLRILDEEIPLDEIRTTELTIIIRKAEAMGDTENAEKAKALYALKTHKEEFQLSYSVEEAKAVLEALTPWEIDWNTQK